jgi:hypothetical protein
MRAIYDHPELLARLKMLAKTKQNEAHREALKLSRVRRSDQGKGALEPDLVIDGCPFWMELQDAANGYSPKKKLAQAIANVTQVRSHLMPLAICHQTGSPDTEVAMRVSDLMGWRLGLPPEPGNEDFMVTFDYEAFKQLLVDG